MGDAGSGADNPGALRQSAEIGKQWVKVPDRL